MDSSELNILLASAASSKEEEPYLSSSCGSNLVLTDSTVEEIWKSLRAYLSDPEIMRFIDTEYAGSAWLPFETRQKQRFPHPELRIFGKIHVTHSGKNIFIDTLSVKSEDPDGIQEALGYQNVEILIWHLQARTNDAFGTSLTYARDKKREEAELREDAIFTKLRFLGPLILLVALLALAIALLPLFI